MPTIGWFEILIIVTVAIIILGPRDFPLMLKKVGSWIGSIKRYVNNVQSEVSSITEDTIEKNLDENTTVNKKEDKDDTDYAHRGVAQRNFTRSWTLSDETEVRSVTFEDGLLTVDLGKVVPEHHARKDFL